MKPFSTPLFDHLFLSGRGRECVSERSLIVVFHGKGDSLEAYREIQSEIGLTRFDALLLNGPMKFADGFKWMHDEPRHEKSLSVVRDQIFTLLEELKEFGYQTENILLLGHSQGGRVAADIVLNSPDAFMGIIAVSSYVGFFDGWMDSTLSGAWKTPWLFTHGTHDRVIRLREIRQDIRELTKGKIPLTYKEFRKGHDFDHENELPFIRRWVERQQIFEKVAKMPSHPIEISGNKKSEDKIQSQRPNSSGSPWL